MRFIWATRGREWGFRFLRDGGIDDPLATYESAFADAPDDAAVCHRIGDRLAVRFPDPEGRRDRSGRPISHEFVVFGPIPNELTSVESAIEVLWPHLSAEYADRWEQVRG